MDLLCLPTSIFLSLGFSLDSVALAQAGYTYRNGQLAALQTAGWGATLPAPMLAAVPDLPDGL